MPESDLDTKGDTYHGPQMASQDRFNLLGLWPGAIASGMVVGERKRMSHTVTRNPTMPKQAVSCLLKVRTNILRVVVVRYIRAIRLIIRVRFVTIGLWHRLGLLSHGVLLVGRERVGSGQPTRGEELPEEGVGWASTFEDKIEGVEPQHPYVSSHMSQCHEQRRVK
ncbi:hypothetical protein B0H14DRAFT_2571900 [Mycena olivaceomarginata]|nr:hypothetical protein B0H14DRAFT_2571900 [Mycena olivaceomarginata]